MNNADYSYNRESIMISAKISETANVEQNTPKHHMKIMRTSEFNRYYRFFENEMNKTVQNNNRGIYINWIDFIKQHCINLFSKDVPWNVVITNWESSSNNETQFNSLFEALK